jgi:hypothetical protein
MTCLQCGAPITAGRSDRKFCEDKCKHAYHNNIKVDEHADTNRVIAILKANRRILKNMLGEREERYVGRDALRRRGFNFEYHTHQIVSGQGNVFQLCFNYGYRVMEEGNYKIVRWKGE